VFWNQPVDRTRFYPVKPTALCKSNVDFIKATDIDLADVAVTPVSGKSLIRTSVWLPDILSRIFHGVPQSLQTIPELT
jgi:hypothetical protein